MTATHAGLDTLSAPMQAEEPPPPKHPAHYGPHEGFFVTGCLNCAHCRDDGFPEFPERWVCAAQASQGNRYFCQEARNTPTFCALKAQWFKDAITGR